MNVIKFYICPSCNNEYEEKLHAEKCCDVAYIYRCVVCDKSHNIIDRAEKCCNPNENENENLKEQLKLG